MAIRKVPVSQDSHIVDAEYDDETLTLIVKFPSGTYEYEQVPAEVVDAFSAAPRSGSFLHSTIKPTYKATKL